MYMETCFGDERDEETKKHANMQYSAIGPVYLNDLRSRNIFTMLVEYKCYIDAKGQNDSLDGKESPAFSFLGVINEK